MVPTLFAVPTLFEVTATEVAETIVNVGAVTAECDTAVEVFKCFNTW